MIGRFWFREAPTDVEVVVELVTAEGIGHGLVHAPEHVISHLKNSHIPVRRADELMQLPIALAYAVLISTMSNTVMTISGDRRAWPVQWGPLLECQQRFTSGSKAVSH